MTTNIEEDLKYMRSVLETQYPEGEYEDGDIWQKIFSMQGKNNFETNLCMDIDLDIHPELPDNVYMLFFLGNSSYFPGFYNKSAIYNFDCSSDKLLYTFKKSVNMVLIYSSKVSSSPERLK